MVRKLEICEEDGDGEGEEMVRKMEMVRKLEICEEDEEEDSEEDEEGDGDGETEL
jgi:hypothetical protein